MSPPQPTTGLLGEWRELEVFAREEVNRHPRTVKRWTKAPDGLPYATLGKTLIIHIPTAREWLLSGIRRPNPRKPARAR